MHPIAEAELELMALYAYEFWKVMIFFFNLVPLAVTWIMEKKKAVQNE